MLGDSKVTSGHVPLIRLDDENICPSGSDPMTGDQTGFQEREPMAQFLEEEIEGDEKEVEGKEEEVEEEGKEVDEEKVDEDEGDGKEGDQEREGKNSESLSDDFRPFILPKIWSVNNFLPKMSEKVFNKLHVCFQIPSHIPLRLSSKNKKCYSRQTVDISFYESVFIAGLRLPLTKLHCWLADYLSVSLCQIYPNAWRIFINAEVLWGQMSEGHRQLTLGEFFYCYKP